MTRMVRVSALEFFGACEGKHLQQQVRLRTRGFFIMNHGVVYWDSIISSFNPCPGSHHWSYI
jgi:hypothetical protein